MKTNHRFRYQIKIVSVVLAALASITFLYIMLSTEIRESKADLIKNWGLWQRSLLATEVDSIKSFVSDIEGHIMDVSLQKLKMNEASYVVFYKDGRVVYEKDAQTTNIHKGSTIRRAYGAFSYDGGYHLQEVLTSMEAGLNGSDYFVKNHFKGPEQITWLCFYKGSSEYILGIATDHKYILALNNFEQRSDIKYALAHIYSFLMLLFAALICFDTYRSTVAAETYEQTTTEFKRVNARLKEALAAAEEKLEKLSITDFLTGLYNRKFFDIFYSKLEADIFLPTSIMLIELDNLDFINVAFGYQLGDDVLVAVTAAINEHCSNDDIVARYSASEFSVIMINTTQEEAAGIAESVMDSVVQKFNDQLIEISFGAATRHSQAEDMHEIMDLAKQRVNIYKFGDRKEVFAATLDMLKAILYKKTFITEDHCERLERYSILVARELNMEEHKIQEIKTLAYLHDIGKIAVPEEILNKAETLTKEEFDIIKTHTIKGYNIAMSSPVLRGIAKPISQHHERWDGSGYPNGISGEEICEEARIIAVVDAYDSMTTDHPYKKGLPVQDALEEIERAAGTQFDPRIAKVFVNLMRRGVSLRKFIGPVSSQSGKGLNNL